jgi:uncharacterized membrane protein
METEKLWGLIIGAIAVIGGLGIGAISIFVSVPWSYKEKLAKLEAKNKERLALIEKGIDPATVLKNEKSAGQDPLFWGLLLAGIGLGILLGYLVHLMMGWERAVLINGMSILFGGVALILYHRYRKAANNKTTA